MKRRKFLITLGVVPPLVLAACKEDAFPTTPTVITGRVVDENDKPVEGVKFKFSGIKPKGISGYPIFDVDGITDQEGVYKISQVVTNEANTTSFLPTYSPKYSSYQYSYYVYKDNKYEIVGNPVRPIVYGQTNTFNFQLRKK